MESSRNFWLPPATSSLASTRPTSSKRSASFSSRWRIDSFKWREFSGCPQFVTSCAMRRPCGGSIVTPMPAIHRPASPYRALTPLLAALLAACTTVPPHPGAVPPAADPSALTLSAEVALKRGDCRTAAEDYAQAAATGDARLAQRAAEVGVACEHLPAAWSAVTRWRTLAPDDRDAAVLYALIALELYRTADARTGVRDYLRSVPGRTAPQAAQPDEARRAHPAPDPRALAVAELAELLLAKTDA